MQPQTRPPRKPDDERRTTKQPQLGQNHTAEGELDLSAIYVVHHGIRRDLRDFRLAVPATPLTDTAAWAALRRRWLNLTTAIQHHTRVEDLYIWPEVARSLPEADAVGRGILEAMSAEHEHVEPLLDAVTHGFSAIVGLPDPSLHRRLEADLDRACPAVLTHLAREEQEALPLMQSQLSSRRWRAAQRAAAKEYGLADLRFAVPWSAHAIPADQFTTAFAHGGPLVRVLLALTRPRFDRYHRAAFRYAGDFG